MSLGFTGVLTLLTPREVETAKKFLYNVQSLLEFLSDDDYATSNFMLGSIEEVLDLKPDASQRPRSYFNGALGMMIEMVDLKAPRRLSRYSILKEVVVLQKINFGIAQLSKSTSKWSGFFK